MLNVIYVNDVNNSSTTYEVKENTISGQGIVALYGTESCPIHSCGMLTENGYIPNAFFAGADMYFHSKVDGQIYLAGKITGSHTYR